LKKTISKSDTAGRNTCGFEMAGSPTSAEYREGMNAMIDAMKHFKAGKVIFDLTLAGALHPDDQHCQFPIGNPRAVNAGQSHVALVLASDIFSFKWRSKTL